jgi:hypothetical protein
MTIDMALLKQQSLLAEVFSGKYKLPVIRVILGLLSQNWDSNTRYHKDITGDEVTIPRFQPIATTSLSSFFEELYPPRDFKGGVTSRRKGYYSCFTLG